MEFFTELLPLAGSWLPSPQTRDITLVLLILAGSLVLFLTEKVPVDLISMMVLASLVLTGLVSETNSLDGFSNPATVTVACMFVLSAGLQRTGVVRWMANQLGLLAGRGRSRLVTTLSTFCGIMSAFINNTAAVAVLLPVTLKLSGERKINPSRVLMPLSFAAQFGGVCTLIGTSTNLLINAFAKQEGLPGFSMFEFSQLGIICFGAGLLYMLIVAPFLLPEREAADDMTQAYRLEDYLTEMRVMKGSKLIGQRAAKSALNDLGEVRILEIIRNGKMIWAPSTTEIRDGDVLLLRADVNTLMDAADTLKIENWADQKLSDTHARSNEIGLAEVIVPNQSRLIGRTLAQLDFYWRYHAAVLGVRRRGAVLHERLSEIRFQPGDTLLLQGHESDLNHLAGDKDFVLLQELSDLRLRTHRALLSVGIIGAVVGTAALGIVSILTAAIVGVVAMLLTRCLNVQEAYESLDMKVIVLLAGLIPLGHAMATTGAARMLADIVLDTMGNDPHMALAGIYGLTMILTALISNNATAVLLAPIALSTAASLGVSPIPFLLAITFAASTCFTTPVGYQTNTMIYGPGGYKYMDFIRVGLPLNILFYGITVYFIPKMWPF